MTDSHDGSDGGNSERTVSRRRVLRGATAGGVALTGVAAFTGTASAGSCLELTDADVPDGFPVVEEDGDVEGALPTGREEVVVFVHGWQSELGGDSEGQSYTCQLALRERSYDYPVVGFDYYANNFWWPAAKDDAEDAGEALADWLEEYTSDNPGTDVRLVAHSLGARASLTALDELQADGESVTSLSLLGAAVDADSVASGEIWADAVRDGADDVYNFYSDSDFVLEDIYSIGEFGDEALGEESARGETPDNFTDVDVTDSVADHCEYFQPDVGCIDEVVDRF